MRRLLFPATVLLLAGCASTPPPKEPLKSASPFGPGPATATGKNPVAKYIELSGFRPTLTLMGKGDSQLKMTFTAINHSAADLEELQVHIRLMTSVSKPGDPPLAEFDATIPALGPHEDHDVSLTTTTPLRPYEMPDWQFLRADFDITSPAP